MLLTDDQHPIQQLTTDRADPSLRDRVGPCRRLLVIRRVHQLGCG